MVGRYTIEELLEQQIQAFMKETQSKVDDNAQKFDQIMELLKQKNAGIEGKGTSMGLTTPIREGKGLLPTPKANELGESSTGTQVQKFSFNLFTPKLEFPLSAGENPRGGIRNCQNFF